MSNESIATAAVSSRPHYRREYCFVGRRHQTGTWIGASVDARPLGRFGGVLSVLCESRPLVGPRFLQAANPDVCVRVVDGASGQSRSRSPVRTLPSSAGV